MAKNLLENSSIGITGHVLIKDVDSGEVILDKYNAINHENVATIIAGLLTGQPDDDTFRIAKLAYGNGGTVVDDVGNVVYKTPQVAGPDGVLYKKTYEKSVTIDADNGMDIQHIAGTVYADIVITSTLDYTEPNSSQIDPDGLPYPDQDATDIATDMEGNYIFDELGIVTGSGSYLTHLIFHPIQKSANRKMQVVYTLRIRLGS